MDYKRAYEDELERQRWQQFEDDRQRQYDYEQREAERREREREWAYQMNHSANSWLDAFHKNIRRLKSERKEEMLYWREHDREDWQASISDFWTEALKVNQLALDTYQQEMKSIEPVIARLEAKIEKLKELGRKRVIKIIEERTGNASSIEDYLLDDDPEGLLYW